MSGDSDGGGSEGGDSDNDGKGGGDDDDGSDYGDDGGSDWSDDGQVVVKGGGGEGREGRVRRRAVFGESGGLPGWEGGESGGVGGSGSESESESGSESEGEEGYEEAGVGRGGGGDDNSGSEGGSEGGDGDGDDGDALLGASAAEWKAGMLARARLAFAGRARDLEALVYGDGDGGGGNAGDGVGGSGSGSGSGNGNGDGNGEADMAGDEDLFRPAVKARKGGGADEADVSRPANVLWGELAAVSDASVRASLRERRFVTGDWEAGMARAKAGPGGDDSGSDVGDGDGNVDKDSDGEVYGDFEDLETGERFGVGGERDAVTAAAMGAIEVRRGGRGGGDCGWYLYYMLIIIFISCIVACIALAPPSLRQ